MKSFLLVVLICLPFIGFSQKPEIFSTEAGAIHGYDAVAYFKDKKPVKGSEAITFVWNGATWHFATVSNKNLFAKNPEKYAPQYGGYCAYGLAGGYKASTQPTAWAIVDNKLYLNYDSTVQKMWVEKKAEFIKKADAQWPAVKKNK